MFSSPVEAIYLSFGLFILFSCLLGNLLTISIFTSLKTFRETSCAFYLTIASFVNIFQCFAGLFSRILSVVFNIDLTKNSTILCKTRLSVLVTAALISLTAVSFAAIDQYASVTVRWRHLANRPWALRLMIIAAVFWSLHGISVAFFTEISTNERIVCGLNNAVYRRYYSEFVVPILFGVVPIAIRTSFGLAALINVRSLARRQVPIVRRRRDQQLTLMVRRFPVDSKNFFSSSATGFGRSAVRQQFHLDLHSLLSLLEPSDVHRSGRTSARSNDLRSDDLPLLFDLCCK